MRKKLSQEDRDWFCQARDPVEALRKFEGICQNLEWPDVHQQSSFQPLKEIFVGARYAYHLRALSVRCLANDNTEHPDCEIVHSDRNLEFVEVTAAELVGRRNPSFQGIADDKGNWRKEYFIPSEWEAACRKAVDKKITKPYPRQHYTLLIYLNGFWLHPEESINRATLTSATRAGAEKFSRVAILNDGVRITFENGHEKWRRICRFS
ncbi:hypothetical protein [Parvularcula marina]|uniref:hypothetical protein n=1 Tax=Parvularcula marina TaxID=2292771 RepID=UPI003514F554